MDPKYPEALFRVPNAPPPPPPPPPAAPAVSVLGESGANPPVVADEALLLRLALVAAKAEEEEAGAPAEAGPVLLFVRLSKYPPAPSLSLAFRSVPLTLLSRRARSSASAAVKVPAFPRVPFVRPDPAEAFLLCTLRSTAAGPPPPEAAASLALLGPAAVVDATGLSEFEGNGTVLFLASLLPSSFLCPVATPLLPTSAEEET